MELAWESTHPSFMQHVILSQWGLDLLDYRQHIGYGGKLSVDDRVIAHRRGASCQFVTNIPVSCVVARTASTFPITVYLFVSRLTTLEHGLTLIALYVLAHVFPI